MNVSIPVMVKRKANTRVSMVTSTSARVKLPRGFDYKLTITRYLTYNLQVD